MHNIHAELVSQIYSNAASRRFGRTLSWYLSKPLTGGVCFSAELAASHGPAASSGCKSFQLWPVCLCDETVRKLMEKHKNHCWCSASGAATRSFWEPQSQRKENEGSVRVPVGIGAGQLSHTT